MSPSSTRLRLGLISALVIFGLMAGIGISEAQVQPLDQLREIDGGDLQYRTHVYLAFHQVGVEQIVLLPPEGFSGAVFRTRVNGEPGWGEMLKERNYNAFMFDHVGCGSTIAPPNRDIVTLTDKTAWGTMQIMVATEAQLVIAQGFSAGFALLGKSNHEKGGFAFVLIDPIGPQGAQDDLKVSPAEWFARRDPLDDALWKEWGWGKRAHHLRKGTDLEPQWADSLLNLYEADQPDYGTVLLTGIDAAARVRDTRFLQGVPVLVVRTNAADQDQIRREDQVVAWLESAGCHVDRLKLRDVPGAEHTTALPWAGAEAEVVLDRFLSWYQGVRSPVEGR